ncbi:hypothetical protein V8E36_008850 [Tilletia maclaganii]
MFSFNKSPAAAASSSTRPTSASSLVSLSVRNANDLQGAVNAAVQKAVDARPKGTRKSYDPKQAKWKEYCDERKFDDGQLVTEAKLLLWLQSSIVPTGNTKKKARGAGGDGGADKEREAPAAAPLSYRTIDGYVSAALDMYKQQQSLGTNTHAHPRGKALTSYLESMVRDETKRKRDEYEDRQAGTIQDGYSHEIFSRINHHYLAQPSTQGKGNASNASRNRLDHLFGAQECHAVVLIMHQGKTNQFGRLEYGGCMRYKDRREDWYDIYLLKHKDPTTAITYRVQYDNVAKVLDSLKISSSKKTHLNRGGGARRAEDNGASEAQIRRAGRQRRAPLSLQQQIFPGIDDTLRQIEDGKDCERDLAAQGFLRLLRYLRRVLLQDAVALRRTHLHLPLFGHPLFRSAEFLAFEAQLKPALDAPEKPVSIAIAEALPEIAQFLSSMQNNQLAMAQLAARTDDRIVEIATMTRSAFQNISEQVQALSRKKVRVDVVVHQDAAATAPFGGPSSSHLFSSAGSTVLPSMIATSSSPTPFLHPLLASTSARTSPTPIPTTTAALLPPPTQAALGSSSSLLLEGSQHSSSTSASAVSAASAPSSAVHRMLAVGDTAAGATAEGSTASAAVAGQEQARLPVDPLFSLSTVAEVALQLQQPTYRMSRSLSSITDVWKEWEEGLNGETSVRQLEKLHGARWRSTPTERKFYSNRKRLVDAIEKQAERARNTPRQAASQLEEARESLGKSYLNHFGLDQHFTLM